MALILIIILIFILIAVYKFYDDKEQEKFDEYINRQNKQDNSSSEEPKETYREPHLKSDPETQKWLYVYDSMEQLKHENSQLKDELKEIHSKLTLVWILAVIQIVIWALKLLAAGTVTAGTASIINNLL